MYAKLCVLLLGVSLGVAVASPPTMQNFGFMQYMMKSSELRSLNPLRSTECLDYYIPLLNDITAQYDQDFKKCLETSDADRAAINDNSAPKREQIESSATDACTALQVCSKNEDSIDYFSCFASQGAENAKSMYTISADSAEVLAAVREEYRLIDVKEEVCTNSSERAYVENTTQAVQDMDDCIRGISPVPSPTPDPGTTASSEPTEGPGSSEPTDGPASSEPTEPSEGPASSEPTEGPGSSEPTDGPASSEPTEPSEGPASSEPTEPSEGPASSEPTEAPASSEPTESSEGPDDSRQLPEEDLDVYKNAFESWLESLRKQFKRT